MFYYSSNIYLSRSLDKINMALGELMIFTHNNKITVSGLQENFNKKK